MTTQERADEVGRRIRAEVDAGRFDLMNGRFQGERNGKLCGCAVGAAAIILGNYWNPEANTPDADGAATTGGLMSLEDVSALETGFDSLESIRRGHEGSPFYALGKQLAALAVETDVEFE